MAEFNQELLKPKKLINKALIEFLIINSFFKHDL